MTRLQPVAVHDDVSTNGAPLVVGDTTLGPSDGDVAVGTIIGRLLVAAGVNPETPITTIARISQADYEALSPPDADTVYLTDAGNLYVGSTQIGGGGGGQDSRLPSPTGQAAGEAVVTDGADAYHLVALADVATSGSYTDLDDTPSLGTAAAADTGDFATAAQGSLADSAVQPGDLAAVATSGAYSDLSGTPTLGTAAAEDLVDAVDTEGVARVVFIENGGELPEGLSAWTLVVELPEE